jgi:hypothetical protein
VIGKCCAGVQYGTVAVDAGVRPPVEIYAQEASGCVPRPRPAEAEAKGSGHPDPPVPRTESTHSASKAVATLSTATVPWRPILEKGTLRPFNHSAADGQLSVLDNLAVQF